MEKQNNNDNVVKIDVANNLMGFIIAKTFSRHANLSSEDFLKEIGFEGSGKSESEAIRIAKFNIMLEATKTLIETRNLLDLTYQSIKACSCEESA